MQADLFSTSKAESIHYMQSIIKECQEDAELNQPNIFLQKHGIDIKQPLSLSDVTKTKPSLRLIWRFIPNDLARSCLFFVKKKGIQRATFTRQKIFHLSNCITIYYTGQELRADDDELVWLSLVHYCFDAPVGEAVEVDIRTLLKDIGWATNGENYKRLRDIISRLKATDVCIHNRQTYGNLPKRKERRPVGKGVSLISNYTFYENDKTEPTKLLVEIDKDLIFLFAGELFTYLPWDEYQKLTPTSRRLCDYALSHKNPAPLSVQDFLLMCGADAANSPIKSQNVITRRACNELVKKGIVKSTEVKNGFIHIQRFEQENLSLEDYPKLIENQ